MINYLGKIAYHLACGNDSKVEYFFERQVKMCGPITADQMMFIVERRDDIVSAWAIEEKEFNAHLG
jgi:hypothetical protein